MRAELSVVVRGGRVVELVAPPPLGARTLPGGGGPGGGGAGGGGGSTSGGGAGGGGACRGGVGGDGAGPGIRLVLVGTAASLVAGDRLSVRIDVGAGDRLSVRSVAAQLALPCPPGCSTAVTIDVEVGPGGRLDWWPEPLVASIGARHRSSTVIRLAPGAAVRWVDELVLGGDGCSEAGRGRPGVTTSLRADLDGRPLLRDGLCTTVPGWCGPAVAGDARYLGTVALLGAAAPPGAPPPWLPLAGPGALAREVTADPLDGRVSLARIVADLPAGLAWMGR